MNKPNDPQQLAKLEFLKKMNPYDVNFKPVKHFLHARADELIKTAQMRTKPCINVYIKKELPLRDLLAKAYLQGMCDTILLQDLQNKMKPGEDDGSEN